MTSSAPPVVGGPSSSSALPPDVRAWLDARHAGWHAVADVSWPRPTSRVWRVRTVSADVFVKISASGPAHHREVTALGDVLAGTGLPVPRLVDSSPVLRVIVSSALPGEVVRTLGPPLRVDEEQMVHRQAGALARRLHDTVADVTPTDHGRRAEVILEQARAHLDVCRAVLGDDEARTIAHAAAVLADAAPDCVLTYRHGDFQPRNWLWDRGSRTLALIDFEEAEGGYAVEDLGWLFATTWHRRADLRDAFVEGYGRPPTAAERHLLAAGTVLGGLRHIADGCRLDVPVKVEQGRSALRAAGTALHALAAR